MVKEPHIIGAYKLLLNCKNNITWEDILKSSQTTNIPDDKYDNLPFDSTIYHAAKELTFALEKIDSNHVKLSLK